MPQMMKFEGKMSTFGGPHDSDMRTDEGLALVSPEDLSDHLRPFFLLEQPPGTNGLARRLNPDAHYIACRWDYKQTSRAYLRQIRVRVSNPRQPGEQLEAQPIDYGPSERTGRVADLSPGLAAALKLKTDDHCVVEVPLPEEL